MEGPGPSPEVDVSISADGGTQVSAPVLSRVNVRGNVSISTYISGVQQPAQQAQECDQQSKITEYKASILTSCETVKEYNSLPGQDVLLADRYTELLIIQRPRIPKEREEELRSRGDTLQQVFHTRANETHSRIHLDQLFKPSDRGSVPRAVILQGHSGHGKSFTVQKIMHDWASELLFKDFILAFHLNCKELNFLSGEHSVVDLLGCDQEITPVILKILRDSPGKVLFVIDGFDELRFSLNEITSVLPSDPSVCAPIEATLSALLKGKVLRQSVVLVTTRSTVSDKLSEVLKTPQRFTEILGFSEDGVKEYFQRFFDDTVLSDKAYEYVRANETLITSCFIPVVCWIVCTVFREHFQESVDAQGDFETTSSIFVHFINTLMKDHCESSSRHDLTSLRSLGQLADKGMQDHQVLFNERKVSEVLTDFNVRNPFLCKFLMKRQVYLETMYSFMHLSFQEFFAALHFFLIDDKEDACKKLQILLKSTADEMDNFRQIEENWRDRVVQFLFGLSNSDVSPFLKSASWAPIQAQLKDWLLNVIHKSQGIGPFSNSRATLFILHCLYEIHENDFVRHVTESLGSFDFRTNCLQRTDYWVLLYCLQCCQSVRSLCLHHLTAENLRMLGPGLCKCKELGFDMEDLSDSDVGDLILAMGEGKTITELCLKSNLSAKSVVDILSTLHKQTCLGYIVFSDVKTITLDIAAMSVYLIQNTPTFKWGNSIQIREDHKAPRQKDSTCLLLTVFKDGEDLSLTLGWHPFSEDSDFLLALRLTLPHMDIISFKEYLQKCHDLQENPPANDERVDALHSSLPSDTDLRHLQQRVRCLTLGQTLGRLSLHTFLNLKKLKVSECFKGFDRTALSFERTDSQRMDTIITYGSNPTSESHASIKLSASSEMASWHITEFILTFDAYLTRRSGINHADGGVDAPLSFLCSVPGLKRVEVEVYSITLSLAAGSLCLIQTHPSVEEIKILESKYVNRATEDIKSYFCSSMCITKDASTQSLGIEIAASVHEAVVSFISLFLSQSLVETFDLKDFLWKLRSFRHSHETRTPQLDEHDDALMSSLHSLPGLRKVQLVVHCLTASWAKRILSLIHSCPTLQKLQLVALEHHRLGIFPFSIGGFLAEEGIHLLQRSLKRPDCILTLRGWRCSRATSPCRDPTDCHLNCNEQVEITIKGKAEEGEEDT